jgi:hypothetical protein
MRDNPPTLIIFRCDHLRLNVKVNGKWHHVNENTGEIVGECVAGTYREPARLPDNWGSLADYLVREKS